jgi:plastocyanin
MRAPAPHRTLASASLALTFLLAACAEEAPEMEPPPGQDVEADELADEPADAPDDEADDEAAAAAGTVEAVNIAFEPPRISVPVGATVTWTNQDVVRHTVTSGTPGEADGTFDEPLDAEGGTASATFDEPGTYAYFCDLHRNMTGEVVVG